MDTSNLIGGSNGNTGVIAPVTTTIGTASTTFSTWDNGSQWDAFQIIIPKKVSNLWKIFNPEVVLSNYWCDENLNMLSAYQLHNPDTIPYLCYEMQCKHGNFTIRRSYKDKLALKLQLENLGAFMVPVPRNVAKRILKVMNRYQEDPQVYDPSEDWNKSGTYIFPTYPQTPIFPQTPTYWGNGSSGQQTPTYWSNGSSGQYTINCDYNDCTYDSQAYDIKSVWNRLI